MPICPHSSSSYKSENKKITIFQHHYHALFGIFYRDQLTRMHSNRMRTVCCCGRIGLSVGGGGRGGLCLCLGVGYLPRGRGVCLGKCLPRRCLPA